MKTLKSPSLQAFINALAASAYTGFVAWLMFNIGNWVKYHDDFLAPASFLMLFVISAAIVGSLILGQPVMLYLDNKKKEALTLFFSTMGWLLFITLGLIIYQISRSL